MIDLAVAKQEIEEQGFTILKQIVSPVHLDILFEAMLPKTHELFAKEQWGGLGALHGHLQQNPPRYAPYVFADILSNDTVIQLTKSILGAGMFNAMYSSNTNCPGSVAQPVHPDWTLLWADCHVMHPPVGLVVNVPLVDVTEKNGSMEIWPGTHRCFSKIKFPNEEERAARAKIAAPMRVNMKQGDVLVRDLRTWHRGMPNLSDTPRHMLAMVHYIHWYDKGKPLAFDANCKAVLEHPDLWHHVEFTNGTIDHDADPTEGKYSIIDQAIVA